MRKNISIILLALILCLSSCEYLPFLSNNAGEGTQQNAENNEGKEKEYWGVKTLYSHENVIDALAIVRQRRKVTPTYTVMDMGENYKIFYNFAEPGSWITYPVDYETFFTTVSNGSFETFIFLENQPCPGHDSATSCGSFGMHIQSGEEYYNELLSYKRNYASVWMWSQVNPVEIMDISMLDYNVTDMQDHFVYNVMYNGNKIIELKSCVKLNKSFFNVFFNSIVIV